MINQSSGILAFMWTFPLLPLLTLDLVIGLVSASGTLVSKTHAEA